MSNFSLALSVHPKPIGLHEWCTTVVRQMTHRFWNYSACRRFLKVTVLFPPQKFNVTASQALWNRRFRTIYVSLNECFMLDSTNNQMLKNLKRIIHIRKVALIWLLWCLILSKMRSFCFPQNFRMNSRLGSKLNMLTPTCMQAWFSSLICIKYLISD